MDECESYYVYEESESLLFFEEYLGFYLERDVYVLYDGDV